MSAQPSGAGPHGPERGRANAKRTFVQTYWFPAKRHGWGWGWGLPGEWQGWAVLISWFATLVAGGLYFVARSAAYVTAFVLAMLAVLLLTCVWKGEPGAGAGGRR